MQRLSIESSRLRIRNLKQSDLSDFHFYRSNPDITKYQGFDVLSLEESRAFIDRQKDKMFGTAGEWVQYGIELKESERLIGDCAIKLDASDIRIAEVGMTISHTQQKKGYAKEAMLSILDFLFQLKDFHRVQEIVDVENKASVQLLKSLGFKLEGHFIENIFFNGKWGSEYQYAMLKHEWKALYDRS